MQPLPFTDQIKIRKQRIRPDIGARHTSLEVLHFSRLLRLRTFIYSR
jgi:hypothetical protein